MITIPSHSPPEAQSNSDNKAVVESSTRSRERPRTDSTASQVSSAQDSDTDVSSTHDGQSDSDDDNGIEPVLFKYRPKVYRVAEREQIERCKTGQDDWAHYNYGVKCTGAGSLEWSMHVCKEMYFNERENQSNECLEIGIACDNASRLWKADARVELRIIDCRGEAEITTVDHVFCWDSNLLERSLGKWSKLFRPESGYVDNNGRFNLEARITFRSLKGVIVPKKHKFTSPSRLTDVILVVEGRKMHVNKTTLALASPTFERLFFDDHCSSTDKEKFRIERVDYKDFVGFLAQIYSPHKPITVGSAESLLALGHRFSTEAVTDKVQQFLLNTNAFSTEKKLLLADKYKLAILQGRCLNQLSSQESIKRILDTKEYASLSATMKVELFERVMRK